MLAQAWIDHLGGECSCFTWKVWATESKDPVVDAFHCWHSKLTSGTYSRHDAALGGSMALAAFKLRGWPGAAEYLQKLEADFLAAVTIGKDARTERQAHEEWARMIEGAEAKAPTSSIPEWKPLERSKPPNKPSTNPEGRRLELVRASTITPRPVHWLWKDRVPVGEITLTPGLAGVGKSTFHAWVIAQVTLGTLEGAHRGTPKPVIVCAHEDSWERSIVPRLMAAGADLDLVWRADVVTEDDQRTKLTLPADTDALALEIQGQGVAMISLDPLLSSIDRDLDSYKSRRSGKPSNRCSILPTRLGARSSATLTSTIHRL